MEPHPLDPSHAERQQRPLVLEATELALDGAARTVEIRGAHRLAWDQGVQAVGLDPTGLRLALSGRAAPLGCLALVVNPGERPLAVLAARRLVIATHS